MQTDDADEGRIDEHDPAPAAAPGDDGVNPGGDR
jgi:hypothetical protein